MGVAQNEVSLQEGEKIPNLNSHFVSVTECGMSEAQYPIDHLLQNWAVYTGGWTDWLLLLMRGYYWTG